MGAGLRRSLRLFAAMVLVLAVATCTDNTGPTFEQPHERTQLFVTPTGLQTPNAPQVFVGAGDIGTCSTNNDEATAALLDNIAGTVFVIGDNAYENGTTTEYNACYDPTWGRHKARTKPVPGNHEYNTPNGAGYFTYFGSAAGTSGQGYYSYDLGAWHIIALNSEIATTATSAEMTWLKADLAAHSNLCTLAYWHKPLYASVSGTGSGGATTSSVRPLWDTLYAHGADVVLNGHRHAYERIAPIKPNGTADPTFGIRTFVVGSGGVGHISLTDLFPQSQVRNSTTFGVLKLYLYDDSYAWKFVPVAGQSFTDSSSTACHATPGGGAGGGPSASRSTVGAAPTSIVASNGANTSTITVTAKDANGTPLSGQTVVLTATGSGNTLTQPTNPTDANGVATGSLSSIGAGNKTVSATISGVAITQTATVTVTAGPADAGQSSVAAVPGTITTGTGSSTITVTVRDAFANPVGGSSVVLAATGTGNTLTQPSGATNGSGVATGTLTSTDPETKTVSATADLTPVTQTANVIVTAQPPPGITHTLLTSGVDLTNAKVYTTASIAPAANALVTIAVLGYRSAGAITPVITGGGMASWTLVASVDFDTVLTPRRRLLVFRAMSPTPGSGPVTITFASQTSNAEWSVSQWGGVETSGLNGANAIVQAGTNRADAVSGLSVSLGAFADPNDVAFGVFGVDGQTASVTPGSGFTEISEQPAGEFAAGDLQTESAVNRSTINAGWAAAHGGAVGLELKASTGP